MKQTWKNFIRRFSIGFNETYYPRGFYAVVDKDGQWVDSARGLSAAVYNATQYLGAHGEDEKEDMQIVQSGCMSFIHSSQLKRLFEAGLVS